MEFLRFGSSIPGSYWGCCAVCIIQNFNMQPSDPHAIQIVDGDGGYACGDNYAGLTYEEVFRHRIRFGTFSTQEMPNHAFMAVLTPCQLSTDYGLAWLRILKEEGFEFIRAIDNSVYTGEDDEEGELVYNEETGGYESQLSENDGCSPHPNYLFGLFRNISGSRIENPFQPPLAWSSLSEGVSGPLSHIPEETQLLLAAETTAIHSKHYQDNTNKFKFYTRKEVTELGVPVTLAGVRSEFPQELAVNREYRQAVKPNKQTQVSAFPVSGAGSVVPF